MHPFDSLTFDRFFFNSHDPVPLWSFTFRLCIDSDSESSLQEERALFDELVSGAEALEPVVSTALLEYHTREVADGSPLAGFDDLRKLITPGQILISSQTGRLRGQIGLLFECAWDEENGLGVVVDVERRAVTAIGHQSECF